MAKKHPKFTDKKFVESLVKTLKIYYPFNDINNNPTQNIDDIVYIITHGAYLNTGCEQDARNFSYLYAKEFLTAIHKDPEAPDYVKKWCKESAEIVIEEIQNELTLNEKYINYSKNVEAISPSFEILLKIRQKINEAARIASQNVKNSEATQEEKKSKLDKILKERNDYLTMYEACFGYLFKDVSCKKAIDYYTLVAATPIMHIDSFIDNDKAIVEKDTFLVEYLRKLISSKFSKASETEQQELSKYALKAASYPPIANNPEYAMDLGCAMTEDDELELGINIICSFHKADMSEWDFSYFDENKKSDKKLISKLFNLFDQNYNIPINENDSNIDTAIKVKKNEILKEYLTSHSLISAFERFGYKNQISQIMKREPPISNADKTQLKDSLTDKDKREMDKIMYGEQYVNRNKLENAIMPIDKLVENTPVTL